MAVPKRREIFSEINITPLTDVFLVLLIIMMVVAPLLDTRGLKLAVPSVGPSDEVTEEPKVVAIKISAVGEYSIDEEAVSKFALVSKIREMKADKPEGVVIETHPEATHEAMTFAMDAAQTAGVTKVAVMASEADEDVDAGELN